MLAMTVFVRVRQVTKPTPMLYRFFLSLFFPLFFMLPTMASAQEPVISTGDSLDRITDSIVADSLVIGIASDSIFTDSIVADSIVTDSVTDRRKQTSPNAITSKIDYVASDSIRIELQNDKVFLYNKVEIYYQDITLKSGYVEIDFNNNTLFA